MTDALTSEEENIDKRLAQLNERLAWSEDKRRAYQDESLTKAFKEAETRACEAFSRNLRARATEIYNLEVARNALRAAGPMTKEQKRAYNALEGQIRKLSKAPIDNTAIWSAKHTAFMKIRHRANAGFPLTEARPVSC